MLANNNRIVHNNAKRDDQRKQRDHIDRQPPCKHQRNRSQHRNRYTRRNPKRRTCIEKQKQQRHHETKPHQAVVEQNVETPRNRLGPCPDKINRNIGGKRRLKRRSNLLDRMLNTNRIPARRAIHPHRNSGVFSYKICLAPKRALDLKARHITNRQLGAIRQCLDHDLGYLLRAALLHTRTHPRIGPGHIPSRVGIHLFPNRPRDLGKGNIMFDQVARGDNHIGLLACNAADRGARYTFLKKPRHKFIGKPRQLVRAHRPRDHDIGHTVPPDAPLDFWIIRFIGQKRDKIHSRLNIVSRARHVPAGFKIKINPRRAFTRYRCRLSHALNGQKSRLQNLHNPRVDIFCASAFPCDTDGDIINNNIRKKLRTHPWHSHKARHNQAHQKQVGHSPVARKIRDNPADQPHIAHVLSPHAAFNPLHHLQRNFSRLKLRQKPLLHILGHHLVGSNSRHKFGAPLLAEFDHFWSRRRHSFCPGLDSRHTDPRAQKRRAL